MNEQVSNKGGFVWWMVLLFLSLIPLLWLSLFGFHTQNVKPVIVSTIFITFILVTVAFEFYKNLNLEVSFTATSIMFVVGLALSLLFGFFTKQKPTQAIFAMFSIEPQHLMSEVSAQMPIFWSHFANTIAAPVGEELLFLVSIPALILIVLKYGQRDYTFLENPLLKLLIVIGITAPLFALFHIGNLAFMSFIITSIIFRSFLITMVEGDRMVNLLPFAVVVPSFAVGFHIMNNIIALGGVMMFVTVMMQEVWGIAVLLFIFVNIIAVIKMIGEKI